MYVCMYVCMYVYICMYVYTHTHTHTQTLEYYSAIKKKEWNNVIWSNMGGPRNYHIKWTKSYKERQISYHLCIESKNNGLISKTEIDSQT